jgi:hypothetical protein
VSSRFIVLLCSNHRSGESYFKGFMSEEHIAEGTFRCPFHRTLIQASVQIFLYIKSMFYVPF